MTGAFYGDGDQLLAQLTSMVTLVVWCSLASFTFFKVMDRTMGMRSKPEDEISGLDLPEMGALAYPDFLEAQGSVFLPVEAGPDVKLTPASARSLRDEVGA